MSNASAVEITEQTDVTEEESELSPEPASDAEPAEKPETALEKGLRQQREKILLYIAALPLHPRYQAGIDKDVADLLSMLAKDIQDGTYDLDAIKVGDFVCSSWKTPGEKERSVRGEVIAIKSGKAQIEYLSIHVRGRSVSCSQLEIWRDLETCVRVEPTLQDQDPGEAVKAIIKGMSSKADIK